MWIPTHEQALETKKRKSEERERERERESYRYRSGLRLQLPKEANKVMKSNDLEYSFMLLDLRTDHTIQILPSGQVHHYVQYCTSGIL